MPADGGWLVPRDPRELPACRRRTGQLRRNAPPTSRPREPAMGGEHRNIWARHVHFLRRKNWYGSVPQSVKTSGWWSKTQPWSLIHRSILCLHQYTAYTRSWWTQNHQCHQLFSCHFQRVWLPPPSAQLLVAALILNVGSNGVRFNQAQSNKFRLKNDAVNTRCLS